jgi:tetratricopeptide (TPR) repeat protein
MTLKQIFLVSAVLFASISTFAQSASGPNPKALQALTRGDFPGAISVLDQDIADGKNLFESYRFRAEVKRMIGQFPGALADVNKAIEIKSDDGRLYQTRAELGMFTGGDQKAILKDLDLAISNGIKHEKVFGMRGMIRMTSGDSDGAIADYQTAISLNPDSAQSYVGLSSAYRSKGDNDKAIELLENFVSSAERSNKKVEAVKGEIAAVATVDTPLPSRRASIMGQDTVIYKEESTDNRAMTPEAAQQMGERLTNTKNTAAAYINLAQMYESRGQYEKALEKVEKGLAIDRTSYFGIGIRGTIRVGLKDYTRAIEDLSQALRINQRFADLFLRRGIAYLMLDRNAEAESDFAKFLEIVPKGQERLNQMKAAALAEKGGN